ncbi:MAG: hypothetical protein A3D35_00700 [Candidatus Staskawiczbacteria bacterium RIFCSPHIGHO2_02_FULL_34_9]|uniref:Uncharacterized protein n=1 Tax=Candidatus Staskawiczbacteria bacterium RIFCSPHIGHO2_02_FULL_34_9 TaxID=1802206 RepID=A0A1G2HZF0_9BACT|nr:MAG: hypothetical protein A3D35_00700 [Candidatus Staskawiczbacteria bacterium RIFCSPHIGHO2_02_FULL_34_9]
MKLMSLLKSKNIVVLGMIAFLAMSFLSLFSMPMDMNGRMINCPYSSSGFCQMSASEHISRWQQFFTMTKGDNLILALFSLLIVIWIGLFNRNKFKGMKQYQKFRINFYRYKPELKLFNYLLLAFSRGIIRSKIYA